MNRQDATSSDRVSDASVHLDAIRGLSALLVFFGHGQGLFVNSAIRKAFGQQSLDSAAFATTAKLDSAPVAGSARHETLGHEAVIVFFVLSGYFVGGSVVKATRKGYFSWKNYLFQRLTRLWIVLLPALLLGWAFDSGGLHFLESKQNIYSAPPGQEFVPPGLAERLTPATFLGNVFFLQGIASPMLGTNNALWSLSYEFWFYVFFPLLVWFLNPSARMPARVAAGLALAGVMALCGAEISKYFLIWLGGAGVAMLPLALPANRRKAVTVAATFAFLLTLIQIRKNYLELYSSDLILGAVFCGFLWVLLHARQSTAGAFYRSAAQSLSNLSYTLYCVHLPCFALLSAILNPQFHREPLTAAALILLASVYSAAFSVCLIFYYCFEKNTEAIREWLLHLTQAPLGFGRVKSLSRG